MVTEPDGKSSLRKFVGLFILTFYSCQLIIIKILSEIIIDDSSVLDHDILKQDFQSANVNKTNQIKAQTELSNPQKNGTNKTKF